MKRIAIAVALLLVGCSEGIEAQLDRCKVEIRANAERFVTKLQQQLSTDMALKQERSKPPADGKLRREQHAGAMFGAMLDEFVTTGKIFVAMRHIVEGKLARLQPTAAGLAECNTMLANSKRGDWWKL